MAKVVRTVNGVEPSNGEVSNVIPISQTDYSKLTTDQKKGKSFIVQDADRLPAVTIKDNVVASDTSWSSNKINTELNNNLSALNTSSTRAVNSTAVNTALNNALANLNNIHIDSTTYNQTSGNFDEIKEVSYGVKYYWLRYGSDYLNTPMNNADWIILELIGTHSYRITQRAYCQKNGKRTEIYERSLINSVSSGGSWTSWEKLITETDVNNALANYQKWSREYTVTTSANGNISDNTLGYVITNVANPLLVSEYDILSCVVIDNADSCVCLPYVIGGTNTWGIHVQNYNGTSYPNKNVKVRILYKSH